MTNRNLSASAQARRLLAFLTSPETSQKGINRFEAEQHLTICHLARRILDLKQSGYSFTWCNEKSADLAGHEHCGIRRYWLTGSPKQEQQTS